jgi:hypothetical protein
MLNATPNQIRIPLIILRVMLPCAIKVHVKLSKNNNLAFYDIKHLIFRELKTQISINFYYI